jgi:hypothetical protein
MAKKAIGPRWTNYSMGPNYTLPKIYTTLFFSFLKKQKNILIEKKHKMYLHERVQTQKT